MALELSRLATVQMVPPTPFTADGRQVRSEVLGSLVEHLAAAGVGVFLPAAGTGEFHSLTASEVSECVRTTRKAAPAAVVIAPVGYGLDHAITIARRAAEDGADALLLMPPVHPYLCDAGFRDYFQAIADATLLPLLAYKRGPVPSDGILTALGKEGRLIGVKYAVNDVDAFTRFATANAGRIGLYCGTAERYAPFFALAGSTGYTSGVGSLAPRLTLSLHAALAAGDYATAMKQLAVLRPVEDYRAREGDSFNISLVKYALSVAGRDFGPPRPPQRRLTTDEQADIRRIVEPILAAEAALAR
jgi:4-hydroxy-tetrahydrodipicolinate synthase